MKRSAAANNSKRNDVLNKGRAAFHKQQWSRAVSQFSVADQMKPLEPEDLESLAAAVHILGRETESIEILARAHQGFLGRGETLRAVRCAFWLGFTLLLQGEPARAGGWLSRASRLAEGHEDCVERGYLLLPAGLRLLREGHPEEACAAFSQAVTIGNQFREKDLVALALNGEGRAWILRGEITRGVALLDEAMVAVTAGEVSAQVAGGVYCSVIEACSKIFDLRRAQEWTSALDQWCSSQPDPVSYRGHCMLRRAEIHQLHGAWPEALEEAKRAREHLSEPSPQKAVGAAFYMLADLHRLRGEFAKAEEAYREASHWGKSPQPGLAQLRLAQGQIDAARAAICHLVKEAQEMDHRARILDACVEIMIAAKNLPAARAAATDLEETAARFRVAFLHAMSSRARGMIQLAEGNAREALPILRQSWNSWRELEVPYESARVQVLIALACREQGDSDTADLELESARRVFAQLGAAPDLARIEAILKTASPKGSDSLTAREIEVLRLVASGMTNREIASKLTISEKTVARHLSNIFLKLDLSSRAAATAYAYQNKLV